MAAAPEDDVVFGAVVDGLVAAPADPVVVAVVAAVVVGEAESVGKVVDAAVAPEVVAAIPALELTAEQKSAAAGSTLSRKEKQYG